MTENIQINMPQSTNMKNNITTPRNTNKRNNVRTQIPNITDSRNMPHRNKLPQQKGDIEKLILENKLSLSSMALKHEENEEERRNQTHTIEFKKKKN